MKEYYIKCLIIFTIILFYLPAQAQKNDKFDKAFYLGKSENLSKELNTQSSKARLGSEPAFVQLKVSSAKIFKAKVNFKQSTNAGYSAGGALLDVSNASFSINIKGKEVEGNIILYDTKEAYKYSSDKDGNTYVTEVDINKVLCTEYYKEDPIKDETKAQQAPAAALSAAVANLESLPGAPACVLLDLDGHFYQGSWWASGVAINALPTTLSDAQIIEAWEIASEDYRPFKVNITTSEAVWATYPANKRVRCVLTPTNDAAPGSGGVAWIGFFGSSGDVPCWVFNTGGKAAGETISHEVGHTMGLNHDGTPTDAYYAGQGDWAPIMGVGFSKSVTQWSKGEYTNANNTQDDLAQINYKLGTRADAHGNTMATAKALTIETSGAVLASENYGIIEETTDVDMFSFSTAGGSTVLNINSVSRHGDLDILATLYNSSGGVVATSNPAGLAAVINTTLTPGTYYISIDGTGAANPATDGYSDYASIGSFFISGTVVPTPVTNKPPVVSIASPVSAATFTAPATVAITVNASDPDGTISKVEFFNGATKLGEDLTSPFSYSWTNVAAASYSITAKATDNQGSSATSSAVTFQVKPNLLPVISITSPIQSTIFATSAPIAINASASDADGSISKVEFFNGAVKLGESLTSPYTFSWINVLAGNYTIVAKATDNLGGTASAEVKIDVYQGPTADAGKDDTLFLPGTSLTLIGSGSASDGSPVTLKWAQLSGPNEAVFSSTSLSAPVLNNLIEGLYVFELTVTNNKGLTAKDQVTITVSSPLEIVKGSIPRFFSPNGDGNNDIWEWPNIEAYSNSTLTIFNQSGAKIFQAVSYHNTWDGRADGKPLGEDAYYYVIQLKNNEKITGAVRIIR